MNFKEGITSIAVSGSLNRWDRWYIITLPWQEKYHLYTTYSSCQLDDYMLPIPPIKGTSGNSIDNSRAKVHLGCLMRCSCPTACHGGWCGTTTDATFWSTTDAARTARTTSALDSLNVPRWVEVEVEFERQEFFALEKSETDSLYGMILLMVQKSQGQPPGIYKTRSKSRDNLP